MPGTERRKRTLWEWQYIITSYAIAACLFAAAAWLSWDWSWAAKVPLLVYLAVGAALFPLVRVPVDVAITAAAIWSPVHFTGLLAIVPRAVLYAAALLCWIIAVPIGMAMRFAGRKLSASGKSVQR
ncbi:hypothetical protein [Shinella sp. BYT-45]|uniref:hypothetical protein n=1 Tax=Shinella sp. BYT-45 TaxID=3377377 RepID=UPI0039814448